MTKKINYTVTVTGSTQHVVSRHTTLRRAAESYLRAAAKYQGKVDLWDDTGDEPVIIDADRETGGQITVYFADGYVLC
jgi:hypothetical protein